MEEAINTQQWEKAIFQLPPWWYHCHRDHSINKMATASSLATIQSKKQNKNNSQCFEMKAGFVTFRSSRKDARFEPPLISLTLTQRINSATFELPGWGKKPLVFSELVLLQCKRNKCDTPKVQIRPSLDRSLRLSTARLFSFQTIFLWDFLPQLPHACLRTVNSSD